MIAALYAAIVAAIAAALWRRPGDANLLSGVRSALWVAWVHTVAGEQGELRPALLHACWFAALVWGAHPTATGRGWAVTVGWSMLALGAQAALGAGALRWWNGAIAVTASVSGLWLFWAMRERSGLVGRITLHWLSFAGLFAYLVPRHVAALAGVPARGLVERTAAVLIAAAAIGLAVWASRSFARAGGTPEPLDAPVRLASDGPFAHLRNPIQLAEIGLVSAAALWWWHPLTAGYALAFALALLGPVRWYEEHRLRARFGDAYDHYCRVTPAYIPVPGPAPRPQYWVSDRVLPSGSLNHATRAPLGDRQIPRASCSRPLNRSKATPC